MTCTSGFCQCYVFSNRMSLIYEWQVSGEWGCWSTETIHQKETNSHKNFSLIMNFYSCVLSTSPFKKILTWPPPPLSSQRLLNHYFFSKHSKILLSTSLKIWDKTCYVKCCFSWTGSWKCVHKIASEAFSNKIHKRTVETIGRNWSH